MSGTHPVASAGGPDGSTSHVRSLYRRMLDPECVPFDEPLLAALRAELHGAPAVSDAGMVAARRRRAAEWAAAETRRYAELVDAADEDTRRVLARRAALGCAPLALVSGAWLQWLSSPADAEDPTTLDVLRLYASDVGVGRPRASRATAYLTMLRGLGLAAHAAPTAAVALDGRLADAAFHLPAVLLALGRRPDAFRAEILGADLCLRTVGPLPPLAVLRRWAPDAADWVALDPAAARRPGDPSAARNALEIVESLVGAEPDLRDDLLRGFDWALHRLRTWSGALHDELAAARDPAFEMAELLRLRAREAGAYHRDYPLDGRPLAEWFAQARTDPGPLLERLARSRLVRPGRAADSPLLNSLIGERGPMFRVFSPHDREVIRRWIDTLPAAGATAASGGGVRPAPPAPPALPQESPPPVAGREPAGLRDAYHLLLRRTGTAALRRFALSYVHGWLARSRRGGSGDNPLPPRWPSEGLRGWLLAQHQRHADAFGDGSTATPPSRDALVESTVQLAPLTLIDGAWLQGFTDLELASSEVGFALFATYWDELGNGIARLNHPRIYRELLAEMGVEPPPTRSAAFAHWPRFRDASFRLPVYWLCIGRFPRTFLPEILGLNLAMELSGVGGSYRSAHIALRTHGFSTRFVDIHNTIDNVATGHSAWAADAIDTYLSGLPRAVVDGREGVWERIRTGYASLAPDDGWAARRAERRARRRTPPDPARPRLRRA